MENLKLYHSEKEEFAEKTWLDEAWYDGESTTFKRKYEKTGEVIYETRTNLILNYPKLNDGDKAGFFDDLADFQFDAEQFLKKKIKEGKLNEILGES